MIEYVTHTHLKSNGSKFTHTHLDEGEHTHDYLSNYPEPKAPRKPSRYAVAYDGYYAMAEKISLEGAKRILVARQNRYAVGDRTLNLQAARNALLDFVAAQPGEDVVR